MANIVLGLQGGAANGTEATFDGQPMEKGVHLRWSFLAALGFPPGGFWLCRRAAKPGEQRIPPPPSAVQAEAEAAAQAQSRAQATAAGGAQSQAQPQTMAAAAVQSQPQPVTTATASVSRTAAQNSSDFEAMMAEPCRSVTIAGCAAPGCGEIIVEIFTRAPDGCLLGCGKTTVPVARGAFRICLQGASICCIRVTGAGSVDECGGTVEPPPNGGCEPCVSGGTGGGTGTSGKGGGSGGTGGTGVWGSGGGGGPPSGGNPGWGQPNCDGWQCWGVPFTLPVTVEGWPARYFGALDPATTPDPVLRQADIKEAKRRLGSLLLAAGQTAAKENAALAQLRGELKRLVQGFSSSVLLGQVPLQPARQSNAPNLGINLMQELLLLALDPYFARVLGLYFVDEQAVAGQYDYVITGYWGGTPCLSAVIYPGLAPGAPLSRGSAVYNGLTISATGGNTSLWRWMAYDNSGNYVGRSDASAPSAVQSAAGTALSGLQQTQQPDALLLAYSPPSPFMPATPQPQITINLSQPAAQIALQLAGNGTAQGLSSGTATATASFSSTQLGTVTLTPPGGELIDQIQIDGAAGISLVGQIISVGALTLHPLLPDAIGTQYAIIPPPAALTPLADPGQPYSTFRHRQADIDTKSLKLVPHSLIDVEWPAQPLQAAQQTGNPVSDPEQLPPPTVPIGFVLQRQDSGKANSAATIPGWIATRSAPKPKASKVPTADLYRLADSQLPDPAGGWQHRVAGFDLFGALGAWSVWSDPRGVEKVAAAPTAMRILQFDNTPQGGGAAAGGDAEWSGGTLSLLFSWAAAAFMMYPDIVTAQIAVQAIDPKGNLIGSVLAANDVDVPAPTITARTVASVIPTLNADGLTYSVAIQTTPPLTALASTDPAQVLMLALPDGSTERYVVRPAVPPSAGQNAMSPVVASLTASSLARIVTDPAYYKGQPCYLVAGSSIQKVLTVPLQIPSSQQTARAQVSVTGSTQNPFLANEQILDPNGVNSDTPEPSILMRFSAPQRLTPPAPPTPPPQVIAVHQVNHLYYNPADASGNASRALPFTTPGGTGVLGYVLQRCAMRSLALADVKRRIALPNGLTDNNPAVKDGGTPRADLAAWIESLSAWLAAYNAVAAVNANPPGSYTPLTAATVLSNSGAQRDFIDHFYGGLLDDELCALADVTGNAPAYVRVNPQQKAAGTTVSDTVDGTGYGRTAYRLAAVNQAGSFSAVTGSVGPYYTRIVTPPRPPVLYKLQPTESGIVVAWALDTNPDVAAYLVYRAAAVTDLADLRYFGADPTHPAASAALPSVTYNTQSYPPLSFVQGTGLNIDARIVGFVPDPRLCARDYSGSDMGEVVLPPGPAPDNIIGVFRLSDYILALGPQAQPAFNYWTPPAVGGIAQVVSSSATQSRLTGLRVGLGRGVPVVVVALWGGSVKALGFIQTRRAGFIDAASAGGKPLDPNAIPGSTAPNAAALNAYAVVAVDIFGNHSGRSSVFAAQMLQPPLAS